MLTYGSELLQATAVESFWNSYFTLPDPFDGLVYSRPSTQATDTYTRLGAAPMPREWSGDRQAKVANEYSFDIANKPYESSVKVGKKLIKFEQWAEVANLIGNQGSKARAHKTKLFSTLIEAGTAAVCEDGQFFFDTDHSDSGAEYTDSQNNDLTIDIVAQAAPTDLEFAKAMRLLLDQMWTFKDDRGDPAVPTDDNAANYILMIPTNYRSVARRVAIADSLTGPIGNDLKGTFTWRANPFLTNTDRMYLFYAGSNHKPIVLQEAGGLEFDDDLEKKSGDITYSTTWWGRAQYGQWRTACAYVFTTT